MMRSSLTDLSIDLTALGHNYRELKGRVAPGVRIMGVVKADAYGHGLIPVSRTLVAEGADCLGVASLEEGLALREAGVQAPVAVLLGIVPEEAQETVAAGLEVVLYRHDVAEALEAAGRALGRKARVHLKVDTGMGRLGLLPEEVPPFLERWHDSPHLEFLGLVSHLAMAEAPDKTYTLRQLREFVGVLEAARGRGWGLPLSHLANSAGTIELRDTHFAMVRPGISLYGSPPAPERSWEVRLRPVMSFRTRILQVKRLPPGSCISYSCTYTTVAPCDVAVLPVGYCNGLSRQLSNRGEVLIRGRRAPIRGRVCMNLIMVEVTHIPGVSPGEAATLLGEDGAERLTADELAGWSGTISYEVYCALGNANPRRYVGGSHGAQAG
uniref:Alanine racemase n=1 Tax=Desulfobacca acetoxidans TaxID=60893 RepID=A0A7V4G6P6_9BACT